MLSFAPDRLTTLKLQLNLKPDNFKADCSQFVVQSGTETSPLGLLVSSPPFLSFYPFMLLHIISISLSVFSFTKSYSSTICLAIIYLSFQLGSSSYHKMSGYRSSSSYPTAGTHTHKHTLSCHPWCCAVSNLSASSCHCPSAAQTHH